MIATIRVRVSSRTNGESLMTRETVFFETLASRAMSLMVCLRSGSAAAALVRRGARLARFFAM